MSNYTYLAHYGVKGQKHGERKYQNKDGSLTPLGRVHYGVGAARKAAHNAKEAIRKKVAPTNVELNAQIRKQRSKNLNKQKREELKQLKKGIDPAKKESKSEAKGTHKKFYEMTDKEIQDKINRLDKEIKLADLEFQASLTPGKRFVYQNVKSGAGEALKEVSKSVLTKTGKEMFGISDNNGKKEEKKEKKENNNKKGEDLTDATKEYRRKTAEINARMGYEKAKKSEEASKAADKEARKEAKAKAKAERVSWIPKETYISKEEYERRHGKNSRS